MKNRTLNEIRQSKEYQTAKETVNTPSKNPFEHSEVEQTVENIVEDLQPHLFDTIFQMICDEMNEHHVFDSSEYLTDVGLELFEDEWFEFYHENHGKIMHQLMNKITN